MNNKFSKPQKYDAKEAYDTAMDQLYQFAPQRGGPTYGARIGAFSPADGPMTPSENAQRAIASRLASAIVHREMTRQLGKPQDEAVAAMHAAERDFDAHFGLGGASPNAPAEISRETSRLAGQMRQAVRLNLLEQQEKRDAIAIG